MYVVTPSAEKQHFFGFSQQKMTLVPGKAFLFSDFIILTRVADAKTSNPEFYWVLKFQAFWNYFFLPIHETLALF